MHTNSKYTQSPAHTHTLCIQIGSLENVKWKIAMATCCEKSSPCGRCYRESFLSLYLAVLYVYPDYTSCPCGAHKLRAWRASEEAHEAEPGCLTLPEHISLTHALTSAPGCVCVSVDVRVWCVYYGPVKWNNRTNCARALGKTKVCAHKHQHRQHPPHKTRANILIYNWQSI